MQTHELIAHHSHPPTALQAVSVSVIGFNHGWLQLRWKLAGSGRLVVPDFAGRGRADGLWQETCFEIFLRPLSGDGAYCEFNLSPSEQWNAYDFSGHRAGMTERPATRAPVASLRRGGQMAIFDAAIAMAALPDLPAEVGLTCVLEEEGGVKSYWALAHGEGPADFHDAACFRARLGPPNQP